MLLFPDLIYQQLLFQFLNIVQRFVGQEKCQYVVEGHAHGWAVHPGQYFIFQPLALRRPFSGAVHHKERIITSKPGLNNGPLRSPGTRRFGHAVADFAGLTNSSGKITLRVNDPILRFGPRHQGQQPHLHQPVAIVPPTTGCEYVRNSYPQVPWFRSTHCVVLSCVVGEKGSCWGKGKP